MSLAPDAILGSVNETIWFACVFCRNQTLTDDADISMLNAVMDAIHEIPRMVLSWEHHDLDEVRTHLGCFDASRWKGAPDLVAFFDGRLIDNGHSGPAA